MEDGVKKSGRPEPGWRERNVQSNWDSTDFGSGYLSLQRGETVFVLPGLEDGWAYACSRHRGEEGWHPPSYCTPLYEDAPNDEP